MSAPPFMQLFPSDYLRDTNRLTTLQHGAYFLLILEYWVNGGLPDDDDQLAAIVRLPAAQWAKIRPVLSAFFAPGWVHARIERDLAKAQEKNSRRVEAGRAGANAKHAHGRAGGNARSNEPSNASSNALASSSDIQKDTSLRSVSARKARKPTSVKTRIAEDTRPTFEDRAHAAKVGMNETTLEFEWHRFRDHHLKVGSAFASWPAAWRTWCANWVERGGRSRAGPAFRGDGITNVLRKLDEARHGTQSHDINDDDQAGASDAGIASPRRSADERRRDSWAGPQLDLVAASSDHH